MLKSLLFSFIILLTVPSWGQFTSLITDPSGDGSNGSLLDGTELSYRYDSTSDSIWFKVDVANLNATTAQAIGVNIMVNISGAGSTFNFWGASPNSDPFHFLLTTWVTGTAPNTYSGTIGIADAAGVNSTNFTNLSSGNISVNADMSGGAITLGLKREDLFPDSFFSGNTITAKIAAAVGSNQFWNDDIYSSAASISLTRTFVGLEENAIVANPYPNPATDEFNFENPELLNANLYSATGQLIKNIEPAAKQRVDISALQAGTYFLVLEDGNKRSIVKL